MKTLPLHRYGLILLVLGTITLVSQHYAIGMAGLTTFVLAYLSKGSRRSPR